jgi:acetyl-CoA acetyltransferase
VKIEAAVVGAAETTYTPAGNAITSYDLTCEAARAAALDAGLVPSDIDGIVKYSFDGALSDLELATALGCRSLNFSAEVPFGGGSGPAALTMAAAAISTGLATNILCYRTVVADEWWQQLSKPDLGRPYYRDALELLRPLGWYSYQHLFGMLTHRHMTEYGTTEEACAQVILRSREHARSAPNALRKDAPDLAGYLASPYTVQPLRVMDDVVWANGSCAIIVSAAARSADAPHGGAHILAGAQSAGTPAQQSFEFWPMRADMHSSLKQIAGSLWSHGVGPEDVQSLHCYDTTPISTILALEGLGLCPIGGAGPFIESGGIGPDGALQVCTNGGHTSAAYIHGFSQVLEAVRRVRPGEDGAPIDSFAVASGAPTTPTSAVLLGAEPL